MLYNLDWLEPGQMFPPVCEVHRIERYCQNAMLFDGDHFDDPRFRKHDSIPVAGISLYLQCAERISQVVGNFDDIISFPTLLNYQRLMTLKMADLVCGEYPSITTDTPEKNDAIKDVRDDADFDAKLFSTVIDISRYGDAIWRIYLDEDENKTFTCWDPCQWFPIVKQDGTNSIIQHCLCWRENKSLDVEKPDWRLHVQIHGCRKADAGKYEQREYQLASNGETILAMLSSTVVNTGLDVCAVMHLKSFSTTNSIYGYDDYLPVDSILAEIMARIGQISGILDKHADPNITGPASMLKVDPKTGEYRLETGKFFAVSQGENYPEYMTWDGQLTSAFKQLEILINQLYILSEMGAALLGGQDGSSQAISGTAMRFKMVNPLAKARRISNSLTKPVRILFSTLCEGIDSKSISVFWADGLPEDPRENIENCKLATGEEHLMPLENGIMEYLGRSNAEAIAWVQSIRKLQAEKQASAMGATNHPGPQDGTGVNPAKKGSETGLTNFHSSTNGEV